jgi:DNA-binding LacI/PurR family transcriptional regulator
MGLCRRLEKEGIRVGRRVSVTGLDDLSNILNAPAPDDFLTTVRNPRFEMGHATAKLLLERIAGGKNKILRKELPCQIIIRNSTGPAGQG